jgi:hypothetical protein
MMEIPGVMKIMNLKLLAGWALFTLFVLPLALTAEEKVKYTELKTGVSTQQEILKDTDTISRPKQIEIDSSSVRYIDFSSGNDGNQGSKEKPWKHHPWDVNAKGNAAAASGVYTYYFKKGVVYEGELVADGVDGKEAPIVLTTDNTWGTGAAAISGGERITAVWKQCSADEFPEFDKKSVTSIWYCDWDKGYTPRALSEIKGNDAQRIHLARSPNFDPRIHATSDDPRKYWWEMNNVATIIEFELDSTAGFSVGDEVSGNGIFKDQYEERLNIKKGENVITGIKGNRITVAIYLDKKGEFEKGKEIFSRNGKSKIKNIVTPLGTCTLQINDKINFKKLSARWKNGTIWCESAWGPGPTGVSPGPIIGVNEDAGSIVVYPQDSMMPGKYCRYFIENIPDLLDAPGEFYFNAQRKKIFVRLWNDTDPNKTHVVAGKNMICLLIKNSQNIIVDNLTFRGINEVAIENPGNYTVSVIRNSCISLRGDISDIIVRNCTFQTVNCGLSAFPLDDNPTGKDFITNITVDKNNFSNIGTCSIIISSGLGVLDITKKSALGHLRHITVTNNICHDTGFRKISSYARTLHNIQLNLVELSEIAYNKTYRTWGSGINISGAYYSGKNTQWFPATGRVTPVNRILVHHNYIEDAMLGMADYGGLETWLFGPAYVYCNMIYNSVGYKHQDFMKYAERNDFARKSCYGPGIYADNAFKHYIFNNIVIGKNNDCNSEIYNSIGIMEAAGFMNSIFNNTVYNYAQGLYRGIHDFNRSYYLNNLFHDIGFIFIEHIPYPPEVEFSTIGYGWNVFHGNTKWFGVLGYAWQIPLYKGGEASGLIANIDDWKKYIEKRQLLATQTGWTVDTPQVKDAKNHDFRPLPGSRCIDAAKKFFVPWQLYKVVGEYPFHQYMKDPNIVFSEHLNIDESCSGAATANKTMPRNNLQGYNFTPQSYIYGTLENWTKSALIFNGVDQYLAFTESDAMDAGEGNFIIEAVVKTDIGGPIAGKREPSQDGTGYMLGISPKGIAFLDLGMGGKTTSWHAAKTINDGKWHHLLVEIDRTGSSINFFIDGVASNDRANGALGRGSLKNGAAFLVGKNNNAFFKGALDFLRVSKGSLKDAETTIGELYSWQFDGPFLKDYYGKSNGKARDVGAIEGD